MLTIAKFRGDLPRLTTSHGSTTVSCVTILYVFPLVENAGSSICCRFKWPCTPGNKKGKNSSFSRNFKHKHYNFHDLALLKLQTMISNFSSLNSTVKYKKGELYRKTCEKAGKKPECECVHCSNCWCCCFKKKKQAKIFSFGLINWYTTQDRRNWHCFDGFKSGWLQIIRWLTSRPMTSYR